MAGDHVRQVSTKGSTQAIHTLTRYWHVGGVGGRDWGRSRSHYKEEIVSGAALSRPPLRILPRGLEYAEGEFTRTKVTQD